MGRNRGCWFLGTCPKYRLYGQVTATQVARIVFLTTFRQSSPALGEAPDQIKISRIEDQRVFAFHRMTALLTFAAGHSLVRPFNSSSQLRTATSCGGSDAAPVGWAFLIIRSESTGHRETRKPTSVSCRYWEMDGHRFRPGRMRWTDFVRIFLLRRAL